MMMSRGELEAVAAGAVVSSSTAQANILDDYLEQLRGIENAADAGRDTFVSPHRVGRRRRPQSANPRGRQSMKPRFGGIADTGVLEGGSGKWQSRGRPMSAGRRRRKGPVALNVPDGKIPYDYGPGISISYRQTFGISRTSANADRGQANDSTDRDEDEHEHRRGDMRYYADDQTIRMSNLIKVSAFRPDNASAVPSSVPRLPIQDLRPSKRSSSHGRRPASAGPSRQSPEEQSTSIIASMSDKSWSPRLLGHRPESDHWNEDSSRDTSQNESTNQPSRIVYSSSAKRGAPSSNTTKSGATEQASPTLMEEWQKVQNFEVKKSQVGEEGASSDRPSDPLTKYIDHAARENFKRQQMKDTHLQKKYAENKHSDGIGDKSGRKPVMLSSFKSRDMNGSARKRHLNAKIIRLLLALDASAHDFTNYASRLAGQGIFGKSLMKNSKGGSKNLRKRTVQQPKTLSVVVPVLDSGHDKSSYGELGADPGTKISSPHAPTDEAADEFGGWDDLSNQNGGSGAGDSFQIIRMSRMNQAEIRQSSDSEQEQGNIRAKGAGRPKSSGD
eukprot:g3379.t1